MQKIQERRSFGALRLEREVRGTSWWLVGLGGGLSFATVSSCSSYMSFCPGWSWLPLVPRPSILLPEASMSGLLVLNVGFAQGRASWLTEVHQSPPW